MLEFHINKNRIIKRFIILICESELVPYRFKKSICKRLIPEMNEGLQFRCSFYGLEYIGNTSDHIDRTVFLCGAYEKSVLKFLHSLVRKYSLYNSTFLDVGANVGNHTLFMSNIVKHVHAFEPYNIARKLLEEKIKHNKIENIVVHPIGLGTQNETLSLYSPEQGNRGTASFNKNFRSKTEKYADIEIKNADEFIIKNNIDDIAIIKIDVEGFEKNILTGLRSTLLCYRPIVIFEMSPITLASFSGSEEFLSLFPNDYVFFGFKYANKSSGAYRLFKYNFGIPLNIQDLIALPKSYSRDIL